MAGSWALATFFLVFALPSSILALLALRGFDQRDRGAPEQRVRRARRLLVLGGALPAVLVVLAVLLTEGLPLAAAPGWRLIAYGMTSIALGIGGGALFDRAAGDPRRKLVLAAETAPIIIVVLNAALVADALPA